MNQEEHDQNEGLPSIPIKTPEAEPDREPILLKPMFSPFLRKRQKSSWSAFQIIGQLIIIAGFFSAGWIAHDYRSQLKPLINKINPSPAPTPEPFIELNKSLVVAMLSEINAEQKRVSDDKYGLQDRIDRCDLTWKVLRNSGYTKDSNECKGIFKEARELKRGLIQNNQQLAKLNKAADGLRDVLQDIRLKGYVINNPKTQKLVSNVEIALGVRQGLNEDGGGLISDRDWNGEDPDEFMKGLKNSGLEKPVVTPSSVPVATQSPASKIPVAVPITGNQ
ncbi:MAG: hypothetical protein WC610_00490 [Patescibacteria group bacterium]